MDLVEYAKGVLARRSDGILAVNRSVSLPGWTPQTNYGHDNVHRWVSATPEHKHVFGYFICTTLNWAFGWCAPTHSSNLKTER